MLCALVVAGAPLLAAAQTLTKCVLGQAVTDQEGKAGVIVSSGSNLCQVKYRDGQVYGWVYWNLRPGVAPGKSEPPAVDAESPAAVPDPAPANAVSLPTILRAAPSTRTLVYPVNQRGEIKLTALVNGEPVRFLVDTGATLVSLTAEDARAAGINPNALVFNQRAQTANGVARAARIMLREIRIEQLSIGNVPAAVQENLKQSLLGMSFLRRLKSFEIREGALTLSP